MEPQVTYNIDGNTYVLIEFEVTSTSSVNSILELTKEYNGIVQSVAKRPDLFSYTTVVKVLMQGSRAIAFTKQMKAT